MEQDAFGFQCWIMGADPCRSCIRRGHIVLPYLNLTSHVLAETLVPAVVIPTGRGSFDLFHALDGVHRQVQKMPSAVHRLHSTEGFKLTLPYKT